MTNGESMYGIAAASWPQADRPSSRARYRTPIPAAKMRVPIQSRWATHVGTPRTWKSQYHGPIGNRYPMFWWVTVPIPTFGFHMNLAVLRSVDGSRYR